MANNINTTLNNIELASEAANQVSNDSALAENTRILQTQGSLSVVRSQAINPGGGGAASRVDKAFVSRSSIGTRSTADRSGSNGTTFSGNTTQPVISIVGEERVGPGFTFTNADGSITKTSINKQGLYQEVTTKADKSSSTSVYQDLPLDNNGSPTGYRVTTTQKNSSGRVTATQQSSMLISDIGGGRLVGTLVDLTDPTNPTNKYNSVLTLSTAVNDSGSAIYNSKTTFPDGSTTAKTYEQINFGTAFDPKMSKGYLERISSKSVDGTVTNSVLKTLSETDAQGNRVTTITNVTDPNNPVLVSQSSKPDPFIRSTRNFGTEMSTYLDYLSKAGYLDINGDGKNDPMTDLLLISRYSKGLRGDALTANLNLGANPPSTASMETKLGDAFSRGLYDINGNKSTDSSSRANIIDVNLIARYMFGARNNALTDGREANDDSISIAANGSNVVALAENDPLLKDFRQIFNLDGISIKTSTQQLKVFYVNLDQTGPTGFDSSSGRVIRNNNSSGGDLGYIRKGGLAPVLNEVSAAADSRKPITRLGDLTTSSFDAGEVDPTDYGLGPLASATT